MTVNYRHSDYYTQPVKESAGLVKPRLASTKCGYSMQSTIHYSRFVPLSPNGQRKCQLLQWSTVLTLLHQDILDGVVRNGERHVESGQDPVRDLGEIILLVNVKSVTFVGIREI